MAGNPPAIMLVLDRSYSMTGLAWYGVLDALVNLVDKMDYQVRFGLYLFPSQGQTCEVSATGPDVPIAGANGEELNAVLASTYANGWGTPTAAALKASYDELLQEDPAAPRIAILTTDGAPNCGVDPDLSCDTCVWTGQVCNDPQACLDDNHTFSVIQTHYALGIDTYVIGIEIPEGPFTETLSNMAAQGGTGDYHLVTMEDTGLPGLTEILQEIAAQNTSCEFTVDWSTIDEAVETDWTLVNLFASGDQLLMSADCSFDYGWHWLAKDTIALCPGLCYDYKYGIQTDVHASFGCQTAID